MSFAKHTLIPLAALLLASCAPAVATAAPTQSESQPAAATQASAATRAPASAAASGDLDPACLGKDAAFAPFADELNVYCDDTYMYIEADNLADHDMMVGITAWNQQVPIPQPFRDENAWRVPLHPVVAATPSATTGQGPIAVAINGVMVYNPTQQDGVYAPDHDPYLIGELDVCGGHSGRADDYHYHIAPVCLVSELAEYADDELPIAYAMDGYPIYAVDKGLELDECRGATDADGNYAYYATDEYPYVNACFSGEVNLDLRPATHPIRPAGEPIHVLITALYQTEDGWTHLEYDYQSSTHSINYRQTSDSCFDFQYVDDVSAGQDASVESYCRQDDAPPPQP